MLDGLYRIETDKICAGFVVKNGYPIRIAPILLKAFRYYLTRAKWIGN
jgi:hypothetical protein